MISIGLYNEGWGETGDIQISYQSFGLIPNDYNKYQMPDSLEVAFKDGINTVWNFESIQPGKSQEFVLCSLDDIAFNY